MHESDHMKANRTVDWDAVWTVLEKVLRPKFRFSSGSLLEDREEAEFKDAVAESFALVKRRVDDPDATPVEDVESFAATVAQNVFKALLKRKYPVRHKLAIEIRSTLDLDPRLAHWTVARAAVGGKTAWQGQPAKYDRNGRLVLEDASTAASSCFKGRQPSSLLTPDLLLTFYAWLNGPYGFDPTINFCFHSLGLSELSSIESIDEQAEHDDPRQKPEDEANAKALATMIWNEIQGLEVRRRGIFLLFEPPGEGQNPICDRLMSCGVCTLSGIAESAGITFDRLCELRQLERVSYDLVAELYGISAKDAENIRRGVTDLLWRRITASGYREGQ